MENFAHNPYRILGVFANDPIKVQTANIAKIRAFNKVGKDSVFESDYVDIFGPIDRSEESLEKAIAQLSSESDSEYYSCLWIHRISSISTTAKAAVDIIRSGINGNDKSSYVNVLVGSLLVDNNELAAQYLVKLFECEEAPSEITKERLISALENGYKGEFEWPPFFWWARLKNVCIQNDTHKDTLSFIQKVFNNASISYLHDLAKSKQLQDKADNLLTIGATHNIAKSVIEVAIETSDLQEKHPNAEVELALSDYANAVLKSTKKYYDSQRFWDAKPVERIVSLLEDILKISFSYQINDECSDFIKKLKKEVCFLAPDTVKSQSATIRKEIETFCEMPSQVRWSQILLRNCINPLTEIKAELGSDNLYYRHISTKIADNALYSCQAEVESAKRKYNNPKNDRESAKAYLSQVLQNALQLDVDLSNLELQKEFKEGKLKKFHDNLISTIQQHSDIEIVFPLASFSLQSHDEIYGSCNDYNSLIEFVRAHPNSPHFQDAMRRLWEIEDKAYPQLGTSIPAYRKALLSYKERFPNSHNEKKLLDDLDRFLLDRNSLGTVYEYRTLLRLWPNHPKKNIILGRIDLASFKLCRNVDEWEQYLRDFPNGQHRDEAKNLIKKARVDFEREAFNKCASLSDYNRFILKYPTSDLCKKAESKIEDLVYKDVIRTGHHERYYIQYPHGRYVGALKSIEDENQYKNCNSTNDYKNYLSAFPEGKFADKAKSIIRNRRLKRVAWVISSAIILFMVLLIFFNRGNSNNGVPILEPQNSVLDSTVEDIANGEYDFQDSVAAEYESAEDYSDYDPDDEYRNNSLKTGSKPYASFFGRAKTGEDYIDFKTSAGNDYVVIVKRHKDGRYINHIYIQGGDNARMYVPDGNYDVYFYSGYGWNPNKQVGRFTGGFVVGGDMQKDGPVKLESAYLEYTLYPVVNGNLVLEGANVDNVFN